MKKRISNVDVFQTGKVLAVLYFCIGLIFVPILLLIALFGHGQSFIVGVITAIFTPVLYAFIGFVGGLIVALIYNLVAGWTGGLEFTVTDVAPVAGLPGGYTPGQIQH